MPCTQHHEQCLTYCAVSAIEKLRSLTDSFARVETVWVPNIRWYYEVLLWSSRSDVRKLLHITQHVCVVLQWNFMQSCVSFCHHLKLEQYYCRKCVVILFDGTFEMVVGYAYNFENFSGRD
jgi:hypothetical protein